MLVFIEFGQIPFEQYIHTYVHIFLGSTQACEFHLKLGTTAVLG